MQLFMLDQKWDYANEPSEVEQVKKQVNTFLQTMDQIISHMVIDGVEVFEDGYQYISDNITEVSTIEVKSYTLKQYYAELFLSAEQYITRVLSGIGRLTEEFYQKPTEATWKTFIELLEGLQWILQALNSIKKGQVFDADLSKIEEVTNNLGSEIANWAEALEHKDLTLIADILSYEISPLLEQMLTEVQTIIEIEALQMQSNSK